MIIGVGTSGLTLTKILAGTPLAWQIDAGAAGSGASPTGNGNTLPTPTTLSVLKDQSSAKDFAAQGSNLVYSAAGGPNSQAFAQASANYLKNVYAAPAPGTTPSCLYLIARVDSWTLNGALFSANGALQIAGSSSGKFTARNGVASAEVAVTAGSWIRVYARFGNATTDVLRMGASSTTGTALGNTAGTSNCFLGVDAAFLSSSFAFGFMTVGALTDAQFAALDTLYSGGRFSAVGF